MLGNMHDKYRLCPLCGYSENRQVLNNNKWDLAQCVACDFVYLKQDVPYMELQREFPWEVNSLIERKRRDRFLLRKWIHDFRKRVSKSQPEKQLDITREFIQTGGNILEIGCGAGLFLDLCKSFYSVYGVDISKELVLSARAKLGDSRVHLQAAGELNLDENFYDGVLLFSLLEHEKNPTRLLTECNKSLKRDGVVIIKVPNYGGVGRKLTGKKWSGYRWPDHVNYFTKRSLQEILMRTNFTKIIFPPFRNHILNDSIWCVGYKAY